jgi:transposase
MKPYPRIQEREPGDLFRLEADAHAATDPEQRDRFAVVARALGGAKELEIVAALGRSRTFVQRWIGAYRKHGIAGLSPKPRGGSRLKVSGAHEAALRQRIVEGLVEPDRITALELRAMVREVCGVSISLSSTYRLLHRLGAEGTVRRGTSGDGESPLPDHNGASPITTAREHDSSTGLS